MKYIIPLFICIIVGQSCQKNENEGSPKEPGPPQLAAYSDSMLHAVGLQSYSDVLTGKLEGNFEIFEYCTPYDVNCSDFTPQTELNGSVSLDTNRTSTIDAGVLKINQLSITPNTNKRYEIHFGTSQYNSQQAQLNLIYGATNTIKLVKNGVDVFNKSLYVPKHIKYTGYDCATSKMKNDPIKANDEIYWNSDYSNKNGILIRFTGNDSRGIEYTFYRIVSDLGKYAVTESDLSYFPKEKNGMGIQVELNRGNFFLTYGTDGRRYNVTINASCKYYFNLF